MLEYLLANRPATVRVIGRGIPACCMNRPTLKLETLRNCGGAVAELVGIECGVVSGVFNLELSGIEVPDWRPRHGKHYHEA